MLSIILHKHLTNWNKYYSSGGPTYTYSTPMLIPVDPVDFDEPVLKGN